MASDDKVNILLVDDQPSKLLRRGWLPKLLQIGTDNPVPLSATQMDRVTVVMRIPVVDCGPD